MAYEQLHEELVISSKGWTTEEAAAQQLRWGKNEIPEEKEPVRGLG